MKRKNLCFTIALLLVCIFFVGCTQSPKIFEINVKANGYNFGSIQGGNATYIEGETITIKAIPVKNDTGNGFFCWLLNNHVVSAEKNYSFVVSEQTAGNYLALFKSPFLEYFSMSEFTINSGLENDETTALTKVVIYLTNQENINVKVFEYTPDSSESSITVEKDIIYADGKQPFAFNIQEDIFLQVEAYYVSDGVEYQTMLASKIDSNDNVEIEEITKNDLVFPSAENPDNNELTLPLNNASFSIKLIRLTNENFTLIQPVEEKTNAE